jgi:hypothetical protein
MSAESFLKGDLMGSLTKQLEDMKRFGVYGDGDSFADVVGKLAPEYKERQEVREAAFDFVKRSILEAMDRFETTSQFTFTVGDGYIEVSYSGSAIVIKPVTEILFTEGSPLVVISKYDDRGAKLDKDRLVSPVKALKELSDVLAPYVIRERQVNCKR